MSDLVKISRLFEVNYGVNLELVNLNECDASDPDAIPFVSRTEYNNGVSAIVRKIPGIHPNPRHTLSVAGGGSVLATFYQSKPYYSGRDLYVLVPLAEMTVVDMLFYAYCIQLNRYKYNYGRQANRTLKDILIPSTVPSNFVGISEEVINSLKGISLDSISLKPNDNYNIKKKGELSDKELIKKYEAGKIDMGSAAKKMLKPSQTAIKSEKQTKRRQT